MKKRWLLLPLAICLIAVIGVGGVGLAHSLARPHRFIEPPHFVQTNPPPWLFTFDPAYPISGRVPLQQAFAEGARGIKDGGSDYPIYAVAWLAQGKDNGEAIVQFAKGDPYMAEASMSVDPDTGDWGGAGGGLPTRAACGKGGVTPPYQYIGPVCGIGFGGGVETPTQPGIAFGDWTAADGRVFLVDRLPNIEIRPRGATPIMADGSPGWLTQPGLGFTSVVVPLAHGYRLLVASDAGPARTLAAANIVMAHLDQCLPIPTSLPMPTPGNSGNPG